MPDLIQRICLALDEARTAVDELNGAQQRIEELEAEVAQLKEWLTKERRETASLIKELRKLQPLPEKGTQCHTTQQST